MLTDLQRESLLNKYRNRQTNNSEIRKMENDVVELINSGGLQLAFTKGYDREEVVLLLVSISKRNLYKETNKLKDIVDNDIENDEIDSILCIAVLKSLQKYKPNTNKVSSISQDINSTSKTSITSYIYAWGQKFLNELAYNNSNKYKYNPYTGETLSLEEYSKINKYEKKKYITYYNYEQEGDLDVYENNGKYKIYVNKKD